MNYTIVKVHTQRNEAFSKKEYAVEGGRKNTN